MFVAALFVIAKQKQKPKPKPKTTNRVNVNHAILLYYGLSTNY